MKILISGSTGFIGSALIPHLKQFGHRIVCLVRSSPSSKIEHILWDPDEGVIEKSLESFDAVIHLSGENIIELRWTKSKKVRIYNSRIRSTKLLVNTLARLTYPPRTFLCASALGYYGNCGDEEVTESSVGGEGFLAQVCQDWEAATQPAAQKGMRVVNLRFGMVLDGRGGALSNMLPLFRWGLGGYVGSGEQFVSWIVRRDILQAIQFILENVALRGPVNVVSPHPVTNKEFARTLGSVLSRPAFLSLPAAVAKLFFGEVAEEMLLTSVRAKPKRLLDLGFKFHYPDFETALEFILKG